jgi:ABC-type multidrug transport system ATPase subunit
MIMITHHIQEAEFLCDKVAIMVNGQLSCYGTPDELKSQYVNGYKVTIIHKQSYELLSSPISSYLNFFEHQETMDHEENHEMGLFKSVFYASH